MRDDYRGRMHVWFKTLVFFVVFNEVQLYRQLKNTTCMELAKPLNQQYRLSCNDTSKYHCLLNGNSTNEFEICKMWKWIPEGNCAYLNTYRWNIDARSCSSSAEVACPKTLYRSAETIKYAACYVKKNTTARQVRNTTCLELVKPSNLQFRMSCNNTGTYHCLLDQSYSKEYEICMLWKWIPKGKCAYFNMYTGANIDERNCTSSSHFVCPEKQYQSKNTTNYSACYKRNNPTTIRPLTSPPPVASNWTSPDSNEGNATSSPISETAEKHIEMKAYALPIILGIILPFVSVVVIYFILMHLKYVPEGIVKEQPFLEDTSGRPPTIRRDENITGTRMNGNPAESQGSNDGARNNVNIEQQPFLRNGVEDTSENPPTMRHGDENITEARMNESQELSDEVRIEGIVKEQPFLRKEVEDTSGSPPTIRRDENIAGTRMNANPVESQESNDILGNEDTIEQQPFFEE